MSLSKFKLKKLQEQKATEENKQMTRQESAQELIRLAEEKGIHADRKRFFELCEKYPSDNWKTELGRKLNFYNQNPPEDKEFFIHLDSIKENIILHNPFIESTKEENNISNNLMNVLLDKNLIEIINKEFDKKIVGENEARKVIFLNMNMRNVENLSKGTDNLIVNALSGTGKDYITEAIFEIIPSNEKEELVKTTPKVLSYTRNRLITPLASWKKCALRMEDVSHNVLNDDSFKVFLSANPNKINFGKSVNKGKVINIEIEGKPSMVLTIANACMGEEQLRRLPNIFLDEGVNQTKEILKRQARFSMEGKSIEYDEDIIKAISYLKRVPVKIPYADKLIKIFENSTQNVIVRTAFPRFLDYIKSSASLHQYQREKDNEGFLIATEQDYALGALCLEKTTSNILMIPLSRLDEKLYNLFKENNLQNTSIDDLFNLEEVQKLGKSERWIRFRLDFLVSKGFLSKKSVKLEGIYKPINQYGFNPLQQFKIPKWNELFTSNTSNTTNASNTTNTSFTSNTTNKNKKEGVNEVNEVNETELNKKNSEKIDFKELDSCFKESEKYG